MCTGAYKLKSFVPGVGVTAVPNTNYWQPSVKPLVSQIMLKGVASDTQLTSGLSTGAIQGTFTSGGLSTLPQLKSGNAVNVYNGQGWSTDAFIVDSTKGVLGDVRVRQALSLALNRQAIIANVYKGAALLPRWLSNPGVFGYGKSVFTKAYDSSPLMTYNLAKAKKLVKEAGAVGKTFTIGTSPADRQHRRGHRRLPGRGERDRAEDRAQERVGAELHQLLHRPQGPGRGGRLPDRELRRLRGPGRAAVHARGPRRIAELRQLQRQADPDLAARTARSTADPNARAALVAKAEQRAAVILPVDPRRAAGEPADHVQGPDRRDRVVRLHVRAVGEHAWAGGEASALALRRPAGWRCSSPACWSPAS